jgi:hypothetical protein
MLKILLYTGKDTWNINIKNNMKENYYLVGCEGVSFDRNVLTFRINIVPPYSSFLLIWRWMQKRLRIFVDFMQTIRRHISGNSNLYIKKVNNLNFTTDGTFDCVCGVYFVSLSSSPSSTITATFSRVFKVFSQILVTISRRANFSRSLGSTACRRTSQVSVTKSKSPFVRFVKSSVQKLYTVGSHFFLC